MHWHPPMGDPTKRGMCRHYNNPATCTACRIHEEEMAKHRPLPLSITGDGK